jgi:hypothetical protein
MFKRTLNDICLLDSMSDYFVNPIDAHLPLCPMPAEPTSGLDSSSSMVLMRCLKVLAGLGTNVVATLHQPRKEILVSLVSAMLIHYLEYLFKIYDPPAIMLSLIQTHS